MTTPLSRKRPPRKSLGLLIACGFCTVLSLQPASATPPAAPQNLRLASDNDNSPSKEWLDTPHGYRLRQSRPRVLLTPKQLRVVIDRMYGPNAREPYSKWFNQIKARQDSHGDVDFVALALIYKATGDTSYRESFIARIPSTGLPTETELYGLDIMFNELGEQTKLLIMQRVAALGSHPWYWASVSQSNSLAPHTGVNWGYHSAGGANKALLYAALFAYTDLEENKDPEEFPFNANNFIAVVKKELSAAGNFFNIERRIAGDPTHNSALPGSFGGIYDNMGYDYHDESWSMDLLNSFKNITGEDRTKDFLHDKYKATFWQNMLYPYRNAVMDTWSSHLGVFHASPRWQVLPLLATTYQDGRAQWFIDPAWAPGPPHNDLYMRLIFYEDTIKKHQLSTNPTAMYFSGPGLVTMRSEWNEEAALALFLAGEGISRRYEDGNSFLLGRKVDVVVQAGTRMTHAPAGSAGALHSWYSARSISRNTIQIHDPKESWDINNDATTGALHSGDPLPTSQNFGGQIIKTFKVVPGAGAWLNYYSLSRFNFPLGIRETSNIIKYEHEPELGYTYTVGESAAAFTRKIDLFEREFLFLRPDAVIIFDRVNSINPNFKKVWSIHTVDQPVTAGTPSATGLGMLSYENGHSTVIDNPKNVTYLDTLLPRQNKITTRGGDTILVDAKPLSPDQDIAGDDILIAEFDIPRWLEILAVGGNTIGTLVIQGETKEGNNSESITFSSHTKAANSSNHWTKISRITTEDLQIDKLTISIPHYFDVENAVGELFSFAPNTDQRHTSYTKKEHIGQWTLNVEATEPKNLDNFLNVFTLKDPAVPKPQTTLLEGDGVSGVLVDSFFALFANDRGNIQDALITLPKQGSLEGLFLNLEPNTDYFYKVTGNQVDISRTGSGGATAKSSAMGTLKADILIE